MLKKFRSLSQKWYNFDQRVSDTPLAWPRVPPLLRNSALYRDCAQGTALSQSQQIFMKICQVAPQKTVIMFPSIKKYRCKGKFENPVVLLIIHDLIIPTLSKCNFMCQAFNIKCLLIFILHLRSALNLATDFF
jgi:hypothetical protein